MSLRFIIKINFILITVFVSIFFLINTVSAQEDADSFLVLHGPYLGQNPPGKTPQIFAPGIISTEKEELNIILSPDGKEIYFSRNQTPRRAAIMVTKLKNNRWIKPQTASFSGVHNDMDPCMSFDGSKIYFGSTRPASQSGKEGCDIWMVKRRAGGEWTEAVNIGAPVNSDKNDNYPTISKNGTIYFQSGGHGGYGRLDVFRSQYINGKYAVPENPGKSINTKYNEFDAFIAPDESYLIFCSKDRPDGFGGGDLYISFKKKDGSWTKAKNLGDAVNSNTLDFCPKVSHDGKYLFFSSRRRGNGDVYWVDFSSYKNIK